MYSRAFLLPAFMLMLVVITIAAYIPGLHGPFLFDDFANLPSLGANGPIRDWPAFWRYITSGTADPTGRPLSPVSYTHLRAHETRDRIAVAGWGL
ncbi:hypothetical protein [Dyella sp. ASV21]|uniref:hypothetical protein n=1 Tax=Dyella sp. ASV21 TaxID=2795114 RepID=UPI0018EB5CFB|nr:hypothetical protein [Dyella sp. ASV21]